jgi:hypothetical protein
MPQGVCLRKFDCMGWLPRTPVTTTANTNTRIEQADERHPTSCRCGCQQRLTQDREVVDGGTRPADDLRVQHGPPPLPQEPCCPAICKAKLDKIVQVENPQPVGDVALVGFAPAPATHDCTPPPPHTVVVSNAPPLYISFCTFLI